jgi:hypothetical protein
MDGWVVLAVRSKGSLFLLTSKTRIKWIGSSNLGGL